MLEPHTPSTLTIIATKVMKKTSWLIAILLLAGGLASSSTEPSPDAEPDVQPLTISRSYDVSSDFIMIVIAQIVDELGWTIENFNEENGKTIIETKSRSHIAGFGWMFDCGIAGEAPFNSVIGRRAQLHITVVAAQDEERKTTVKVGLVGDLNVRNRYQRSRTENTIDCESTGEVERIIFNYIERILSKIENL